LGSFKQSEKCSFNMSTWFIAFSNDPHVPRVVRFDWTA
jgi:hypothetical protein